MCVTTRVVVGPKVLWTGGKLYDDSATVQVVVDAALATAAARAERSIIFQSVGSFHSRRRQWSGVALSLIPRAPTRSVTCAIPDGSFQLHIHTQKHIHIYTSHA